MKIVFLGDVVGKDGMQSLKSYIPMLKSKYSYDFLIINGENATNGKGINIESYKRIIKFGADAITLGNHYFRHKEIETVLNREKNIVRPANIDNAPGSGCTILSKNNYNLLVVNLMTNQYMEKIHSNVFDETDNILNKINIQSNLVSGVFIDLHGACAYEKKTLGYFCDGKVSAIVGTHTHVATSDATILPKGTGYLTDAGMCGDLNSCAGANPKNAIKSFIKNTKFIHEKTKKKLSVSGAYIEIDNETKLTNKIEQITLTNDI